MIRAYVGVRSMCPQHGDSCTCAGQHRLVPVVYVVDGAPLHSPNEPLDDDVVREPLAAPARRVRLEQARPRNNRLESVRLTPREQRRLWREEAFRRARGR